MSEERKKTSDPLDISVTNRHSGSRWSLVSKRLGSEGRAHVLKPTSPVKTTRNYISHGSFHLLLIALTCGVVGVVPVSIVLATKRPIVFSIGSVAVGACAGCGLGRWVIGRDKLRSFPRTRSSR